MSNTPAVGAAPAVMRSVPVPAPAPGEAASRLLGELGDVTDEHILIIGQSGLDLMCELLRRGAAATALLSSHERLEPDSVSLVVVLRVPSLDWLAAALPHLRRALVPTGRLVIYAGIGTDQLLIGQIRRLLLQHGYSALRTSRSEGHLVLSAQVPAFGLRRVA